MGRRSVVAFLLTLAMVLLGIELFTFAPNFSHRAHPRPHPAAAGNDGGSRPIATWSSALSQAATSSINQKLQSVAGEREGRDDIAAHNGDRELLYSKTPSLNPGSQFDSRNGPGVTNNGPQHTRRPSSSVATPTATLPVTESDSNPHSLRRSRITPTGGTRSNPGRSIVLPGFVKSTNTSCSDAHCTQFLSLDEKRRFEGCTNKITKRKTPLRDGSCRFMNGSARPTVALASFPGSGNTWVRGLLQKTTGICTGAIYCDTFLRSSGFIGEYVVGPSVLVVKTHSDLQCFQATIHLLRSPTDAIVSEWNRHTGEKGTTGSKHTAIASPSQFGGNKEWDNFLHDYMKRWKTSLLRIAKFRQKWPTLNVYYEDLKTNATREVHRMLTFLGVPHTTEEVDSQLNEGGPQALHRHHRHRSNGRYFTADQIMFTYNFLMHLQQELRKSGLGDIIERYV